MNEKCFLSLVKSFQLLIFPSLNLTLNQSNFLFAISHKTKNEIENMKNNNLLLFEFIVELKRMAYLPYNEHYNEIFIYYYDLILIVESLGKLEKILSEKI